jgi:hypothetical protein
MTIHPQQVPHSVPVPFYGDLQYPQQAAAELAADLGPIKAHKLYLQQAAAELASCLAPVNQLHVQQALAGQLPGLGPFSTNLLYPQQAAAQQSAGADAHTNQLFQTLQQAMDEHYTESGSLYSSTGTDPHMQYAAADSADWQHGGVDGYGYSSSGSSHKKLEGAGVHPRPPGPAGKAPACAAHSGYVAQVNNTQCCLLSNSLLPKALNYPSH